MCTRRSAQLFFTQFRERPKPMSKPSNPKPKAKKGTRERRWRIPRPLLGSGADPGPEGLTVLNEFRSELGMVLVKTIRSVILWSQVEPQARNGLFGEGAADRRLVEILSSVPDEEAQLREALEDLVVVLSRPERADPEAVGIACNRIAGWAEARDAPQTALEFKQGAALACPANPRFALQVGQASRDLAQYARADAWLQRAVGLARQVSDWEIYVRAYLAHGTMLMRRGALPAARRSLMKAQRRASRQGVRALEAMAYHDLFVLADQMGDLDLAVRYAEKAARFYGAGSHNLPNFAHDVAYLWTLHGEYSHAYSVFLEVLDRVEPRYRPAVLGGLARAAGGLGDPEAFESAAAQLERTPGGPGVSEAWVDVARGAVLLGVHERANAAAELAERMARNRGEGQVRFMAESVLEEARGEARAVEGRRSAAAGIPGGSARYDRLAREVLRRLTASTPAP
jgi:tetratricopeptide (TPR) repeat protein